MDATAKTGEEGGEEGVEKYTETTATSDGEIVNNNMLIDEAAAGGEDEAEGDDDDDRTATRGMDIASTMDISPTDTNAAVDQLQQQKKKKARTSSAGSKSNPSFDFEPRKGIDRIGLTKKKISELTFCCFLPSI